MSTTGDPQLLLTLPVAMVRAWDGLGGRLGVESFVAHDPEGGYLGSGGATVRVLREARRTDRVGREGGGGVEGRGWRAQLGGVVGVGPEDCVTRRGAEPEVAGVCGGGEADVAVAGVAVESGAAVGPEFIGGTASGVSAVI